jgi:iron complex transport system substrate-binding protein
MKKYFLFFIIIFLFSGCEGKTEKIVDRSGRQTTIRYPVNRVISAAPSNTEIIVDLRMADKLVAVDKHSANIEGIPENLAILDFFYPNAETIINLHPDLIIASGHNATGTGEDPFRLFRMIGIPVVYISMSKSIEDIYLDIAFIAGLLQIQEEGEHLINSMKEQINEIVQKIYNENITAEQTPAVYFELSAAPDIMTFGKDSFIGDMISVLGARNIFENDDWLVRPSAEVIIERNPEVILTNVNYIDNPISEIKSRPGFNHIVAVKQDNIYLIDNDSSSRPSSRIILALRQMAKAIYPLRFNE